MEFPYRKNINFFFFLWKYTDFLISSQKLMFLLMYKT